MTVNQIFQNLDSPLAPRLDIDGRKQVRARQDVDRAHVLLRFESRLSSKTHALFDILHFA
jgi:hypothetical protein